MVEKLTVDTPVGTVLWDNTREHDKYAYNGEGWSVTIAIDPGDEAEQFKTELLDFQYNTLGPDVEIPHPLLKERDGQLQIKAKTRFPVGIFDSDGEPVEIEGIKGLKARIKIVVQPYDAPFGKGLSAYLQGVQLESSPGDVEPQGSSKVSFGKLKPATQKTLAENEVPF